MMAHLVSLLEAATHDVGRFTCGTAELDKYLQTTAGQHQAKKIARTYVLTEHLTPTTILGFFTLAIRPMTAKGSMPANMARKLPARVPGYTLARLAVAQACQGQGYGELLLMAAMRIAKAAAERVGGFALFVDAKDAKAARFYQKFGFTPFPSNPLTLVIPVSSIPD
jgi:GNAT superfamily N-acetyltransferase